MTHKISVMILLVIIALASFVCSVKSDSHTVMVKPTDSNLTVCRDSVPCDTLSNLLSNESAIFRDESDLILKFLKGHHTINSLKTYIKIAQKRKVLWYGNDAMVFCKTGFTFVFDEIEILEIHSLNFLQCGNKIDHSRGKEQELHNISAALFLSNVNVFHCKAVTIAYSKGYGLLIFNHIRSAQINNCSFLYNNKDCKPNSTNNCVGGNIVLYFFTQQRVWQTTVNVSVKNCIFEGGSDLSETTSEYISCMYRQKMPYSVSTFRANSLAIIFAQKNYVVQFQVSKTKFSNITRNNYPAVVVHDYSDVSNMVEFDRSNFTNESLEHSAIFGHHQFFPLPFLAISKTNTAKMASVFFTIKNCSFNTSSAIHICVKPTTKNYSSTYSSLIRVNFTKFFPRDCYWSTREQPTVLIDGSKNSEVIWKYGNSNRKETNTVEFTNCHFNSKRGQITALQIQNSQIVLRNCKFYYFRRTAVIVVNSIITSDGCNVFSLNNGRYGGAMRLNRSLMFITSNSKLCISRNNASYGGGIFAIPIELKTNNSFCTFNIKTSETITKEVIILEKNRARYGGHSIFAASSLYICTGKGQYKVTTNTASLPHYIRIIPLLDENYTEVSSPANRLCLCKNNKPQTNKCNHIEKTVFPGQIFNVSLIVLGELNGSTAVITTTRPTSYFTLNLDNKLYFSHRMCETFNYSVHKPKRNSHPIHFRVKISNDTPKPIRSKNKKPFTILTYLSSCPPGLNYSKTSQICVCSHFIEKFDMTCDNKRGIIHINKDRQWISFDENLSKVAIAMFPLDYLVAGKKDVNVSEPDEQCNFNRSGVLCGACPPNFSMVLGNSNCRECPNVHLLLIIPFALAGVALVVLLLKCNLTVSVGHINGIIFYANIVQVNKALLFPQKGVVYEIFSTSISWLNLDLGIETCFFANMDTYAKVCLQFVFPVYLWIIVGLIILAAYCSSRMGRLIGDNSVPVLATLLLLSYAKLLRTIIAAVTFAYIEFEDGTRIAVWLHDGNVKYLYSKHIALFLIALLFLFTYILPLILLVSLAPCLQAWSHHRGFRWVNRLKPFLDAYQGPYNDKFRYWTGLLLLARLVLFVVYAANFKSDCSMNFFWTIAVTVLLIAVLLGKPVYRHRIANRIELFCLVNIMILYSVNWLTSKTDYEEWRPIGLVTTYTSVAVIILTFFFIILYQQTKLCSCICTKLLKSREHGENTDGELTVSIPTSSVVELEECDQLKEPLLDSD